MRTPRRQAQRPLTRNRLPSRDGTGCQSLSGSKRCPHLERETCLLLTQNVFT